MSIYSEGLPDDLTAPAVVIGASGYYVSAPYQQTRSLATVWIVLIVVFLFVLLIAFSFYWGNGMGDIIIEQQIIPGPPPPVDGPNTRVAGRGPSQAVSYYSPKDGSAITTEMACTANSQAQWNSLADRCQCRTPYWGGTCERESYKPQYIAAGIVKPDDIILALPQDSVVDNLSYATTSLPSCTDLCDAKQDGLTPCAGVKWDAETKTCTTFTAAVLRPNRHPVFSKTIDSNLYVREDRLNRFDLDQSVLIFGDQVPRDWWLADTIVGDGYALVSRGICQILTFYPLSTLRVSAMTGVYTRFPFKRAEFPTLVNGGNTATVYVVPPGQFPIVPVSWGAFPIWVMYDFV